MRTIRIHVILWVLLAAPAALAQTQSQEDHKLVQVFSPNAAELGKYGSIPVSYYNGLPNIEIPLAELRAKNYTLPVYLSYHASGIKPDQHPGWVGSGWSILLGAQYAKKHNYRKQRNNR